MALIDEMRRQEQMRQPTQKFDVGSWAQQQEQSRAIDTQKSQAQMQATMDQAESVPAAPALPKPLPSSTSGSASAVSSANDAALKYSGFPLTQSQKSTVASQFDADQRSAAAGAEAARMGVPYAPGMGGSAPAPTPAPAAPTAPNPTDQRLAAGAQSAPGAASAPSLSAAPAPAPTGGNVTYDPQTRTYSGANIGGDVTINGQTPRNGGQVSSQNNAAAENLAGRQGLAAYALSQPAATQPSGAGASLVQAAGIRPGGGPGSGPVEPGSFTGGFSGVIGQQSGNGNMWSRTPEQQRRDAEVSASSIMNNGGRWDQHKGMSPERAALQALDVQAIEGIRGQNSLAQAALNANASLQREGMQQQGETGRSLVRAMLDQQRVNQAAETQGFTNRAAGLVEAMRNQVAQEKDPAKRKGLVQHMLDLEGKAPQADPFLVVPGGQHVDPLSGKAYNVPSSVFNRQTGQWMQQPGAGGAAPPSAAVSALRADPKRAVEFDAKYGPGSARAILGG